jgi:hypothetical protein
MAGMCTPPGMFIEPGTVHLASDPQPGLQSPSGRTKAPAVAGAPCSRRHHRVLQTPSGDALRLVIVTHGHHLLEYDSNR